VVEPRLLFQLLVALLDLPTLTGQPTLFLVGGICRQVGEVVFERPRRELLGRQTAFRSGVIAYFEDGHGEIDNNTVKRD
jgi:hypothetical protein